MNLVIIGATGRTGLLATEAALARGDNVTAIVRTPAKLGPLAAQVTVVDASTTDTAALTRAITGSDAVVSALGHNGDGPHDLMEQSMKATIEAMDAADVRRLVAISASGHSTDGDGFFTRSVVKPILGRFLRDQFIDMKAMERVIVASDRDWTIVRPPMLTNKARQGHYKSRRTLNVRGSFSLARADLADAVLDQLADDASVRTVVSVAG